MRGEEPVSLQSRRWEPPFLLSLLEHFYHQFLCSDLTVFILASDQFVRGKEFESRAVNTGQEHRDRPGEPETPGAVGAGCTSAPTGDVYSILK